MTDSPLADVIQDAVASWCAGDGSMVTNFIFSAEFIDNDGVRSSAVTAAPDASVQSRLGLTRYAENFFDEMQRRDLMPLIYPDGECDCGDSDET